jgi:hypothetical protein
VDSFDGALACTRQAVRRQLQAMPCACYEVRLIHSYSRRCWPGERRWPPAQLLDAPTLRFLRIRNREGYDVYIRPWAGPFNAGYLLVDLDASPPRVLSRMRSGGHEPCVVIETSPGNLQAWVRVSLDPLQPAVATAIGRRLAREYEADPASADWRHLGRLAGFTNQKPGRRLGNGLAPWVKLLFAAPCLASDAGRLLQAVNRIGDSPGALASRPKPARHTSGLVASPPTPIAAEAAVVYQRWVSRFGIWRKFAEPDWSVVDFWVARALVGEGLLPAEVEAVIRLGSPAFPRHHPNPADYLRRTIDRARAERSAR